MGCERRAARSFRSDGIKPVDRYYVHLSRSRQIAEERSAHLIGACVVEVLARQAQADGIEFYARGDVVLTRHLPAQFVGEIWDLEPATGPVAAAEDAPPKPEPPRPAPQKPAPPRPEPTFGRRLRKATGRR
jgi:hypothetical protein